MVPGSPRGALRAARSWLGVLANTSRMVSLNCRMLAKPAAKAMSEAARSVLSSRIRAVWARWARASASGGAPSAATRVRLSWRSE